MSTLTIDPQATPATPAVPVVAPHEVKAAPGTPEYDAQMVAAAAAHRTQFEAPAVEENTPATRPEWLPEKFWDAEKGQARYEAMAQSYAELERGRSAPAPATPATPATPEAAPAAPTPTANNWESVISNELATNGAVSEETYKSLETAGFSRGFVNNHIAGQQALAEKTRGEILESVGGADTFKTIQEWAAGALSAEELTTFNNQAVANVESAKLAVQWLKAKYEAANGSAPRLLSGKASPTTNGFRSQEEVVSAIRDPRYSKDPAYRDEVARRLASKAF